MPDAAQLIGAWRLVAWQTEHADGSVRHPFGEDAIGLLVYGASGHMSGAMMRAARVPFSRPRDEAVDLDAGNPSELADAFNSFLAYAGRWEVSDATVRHHVEVASIPGWPGRTLMREATLAGEELTLRTPPRVVDGLEQRGVLRWERAR